MYSISRVPLADIKTLTFFKDSYTNARRVAAVPQLTCVGNACKLFQPEVVRCYNAGGQGSEVEWTCEADLPEKLRFGRIEVSCEGWDRAGDPYVLKGEKNPLKPVLSIYERHVCTGSCGLTYRLVKVPDALNDDGVMSRLTNAFSWDNISSTIFHVVWWTILFVILYYFLKSCLTNREGRTRSSRSHPRPPPRPPGSGWNRFNRSDYPPPPYSEQPKPSNLEENNSSSFLGLSPGFWSGLGLGGLAGGIAANMFRGNRDRGGTRSADEPRLYDWERERASRVNMPTFRSPSFQTRSQGTRREDDNGEGPSNLGSMRRSTGYAASSVR